ncbi:MAG: hypothetical protein AB7F86_11355 [Bdellovibrionales bacterium]
MGKIELNQIRIATPCHELWSRMKGDDRVRFCGACKMNVYNVSGLNKEEVDELLFRLTKGERVCMRLARRADGTIITRDCPVGIKLAQRMKMRVAALRLMLFSVISGSLWLRAEEPKRTMGKPAAVTATMGSPVEQPRPNSMDDERHFEKGEMLAPSVSQTVKPEAQNQDQKK